ncbi:MAG: ABC transporter permease [Betaproteobacteria bacterium]|nr:ABC transporter permease [Betaproteobacteria bacterium]
MPQSPPAAAPGRRATSLSPNQRAWARFKRNRLGHVSLILFAAMLIVGSFAELFSNERPLLARYNGDWFVPVAKNPPELRFGGDFATPTDWHDPFIVQQFAQPGNFALFTLNTWGAGTLYYYARAADPVAPGKGHWLGTDSAGRDMTARLLYGFRVSIYFGLALTFVGTALGILVGALQGYFGGRVDLTAQRVIEIWNAVPELYLLIIIASIFAPTLLLLIGVFALFGWIGLSDYVRAEFLRNRNLEFVKAARAMGLSNAQIMWRHILPNSMTPVITFLPFRMSAAILFLTALDFLGLGVPDLPSLGDLLRQGKDNLDAWWIAIPTFAVLVATMLLLTFIGDALRDAFDTRKS